MILLLAAIQFIILSDYLVVMPLGPNLIETLGINTQQFAGLISVYSLGAIIVSLLTAGFLDRYNRVRELQVSFILFIGVSVLHLFADSYHLLVWLRFSAGGLAGLCGSLILSLISQTYASNRRGRIIGIVLSATSIAQIIAIPAGLFLVVIFGWKAPFLMNAMLGIGILFLLFAVKTDQVPNSAPTSRSVYSQMFGVLKQRYHVKAMLCTLLTMLSGTLIVPFLPLLLVYKYHVAENQLGGVYFIAGLFAFVASLLSGRMAEAGTGKSAIYFICSLGILPLTCLALCEFLPQWCVIAVFTVCNALFVVRMIPINRFVMEYIHPDFQGGFQSINTALLHIGASLAAWTGGQLVSTDANTLFGFGNVAAMSTAILVFLFSLIHFGFPKDPHTAVAR